MFNLTVEDASKRLGVGRARVNQLIRSGMLAAEKVGGIWLIDEQSVEARRNAAPKAGRPPASSSKGDVGRYVLMNRTHEVLSFRYDEAAGAFVDAGDIVDPARAPAGHDLPQRSKRSRKTRCRSGGSIAASRNSEKASSAGKLARLGVDSPARIPFKSLGLSLSDQYWIRPENCEIAWEDVNYFDNDFCEMRSGRGWLDGVGLDSPDNTSEGELPKKLGMRRCEALAGEGRIGSQPGAVQRGGSERSILTAACPGRVCEISLGEPGGRCRLHLRKFRRLHRRVHPVLLCSPDYASAEPSQRLPTLPGMLLGA